MSPRAQKALRIAGYAYLSVAFTCIAIGLISIVVFEGFEVLFEILNPFNVANFAVTMITLAPGLLLLHWAGSKPS